MKTGPPLGVTRTPLFRAALALGLLLFAGTGRAHADWLITPFFGGTFAGETTFVDFEQGASAGHVVLGGSGAWLTHMGIGVETDFAYALGFFERDNPAGVVVSSNVTTLTGSVILAAPLSLTRESLRPYFVGGLGLIHAHAEDILGVEPVNANVLGMNLGAGAIGFVNNRAGLRFDIRNFRTLQNGEAITGIRSTRLSFWRATVGVTIRY